MVLLVVVVVVVVVAVAVARDYMTTCVRLAIKVTYNCLQ